MLTNIVSKIDKINICPLFKLTILLYSKCPPHLSFYTFQYFTLKMTLTIWTPLVLLSNLLNPYLPPFPSFFLQHVLSLYKTVFLRNFPFSFETCFKTFYSLGRVLHEFATWPQNLGNHQSFKWFEPLPHTPSHWPCK